MLHPKTAADKRTVIPNGNCRFLFFITCEWLIALIASLFPSFITCIFFLSKLMIKLYFFTGCTCLQSLPQMLLFIIVAFWLQWLRRGDVSGDQSESASLLTCGFSEDEWEAESNKTHDCTRHEVIFDEQIAFCLYKHFVQLAKKQETYWECLKYAECLWYDYCVLMNSETYLPWFFFSMYTDMIKQEQLYWLLWC